MRRAGEAEEDKRAINKGKREIIDKAYLKHATTRDNFRTAQRRIFRSLSFLTVYMPNCIGMPSDRASQEQNKGREEAGEVQAELIALLQRDLAILFVARRRKDRQIGRERER